MPAVQWKFLATALSVAVVILTVDRQTFWRSFDDTPQESVASFHAYGFAAASTVGLWPNPVVARDIDIEHSLVRPYAHWPNGFFLLFEGVLRVFGRTEAVGRWFAILGTLLGFTLLIVSLGWHGPLLYAALPLILLSGPGRDSVPFVFIDVALNASIGLLFFITAYLHHHPHYHLIFRLAMLAALFANQLVLPYAAVIAALKWFEGRSARHLLVDLAVLGSGGIVVLLALAASAGDLRLGAQELGRVVSVRATFPLGPWYQALNHELRNGLNLGPLTGFLIVAAWLICFQGRQWRTCLLAPAYLMFALLLPEYVGTHEFARLPFVFFCLVTLLVGIGVLLERLAPAAASRWTVAVLQVGMAAALGLRGSAGEMRYRPDHGVQHTRDGLRRICNDPVQAAVLQGCNAFRFRSESGQQHPRDRMGQFFFGLPVVDRVRRGTPIRTCLVDLPAKTVRLVETDHP